MAQFQTQHSSRRNVDEGASLLHVFVLYLKPSFHMSEKSQMIGEITVSRLSQILLSDQKTARR